MTHSRSKIQEYLTRKGLRFTPQREIVFEAFLAGDRHVSVDELYKVLRPKHPTLGYSTVHRTMKLFVNSGVARAVSLGGDCARYEPVVDEGSHDHLVCRRCSSVIDFRDDTIQNIRRQVFMEYGFQVDTHALEMHGLCLGCRS